MAINLKGFPAHFPYQDGWKFCVICQCFYYAAKCPRHPINKLRIRNNKKIQAHAYYKSKRADCSIQEVKAWEKLAKD